MAQITTVSVVATGWIRLDSLASHKYLDLHHDDDAQSLGVRIAGADPTAGVAWNAAGSVQVAPADNLPMPLGATDQVWARSQTGPCAVDVIEST